MRNLFKNVRGEKVDEIGYTLDILKKCPTAKIYIGSDSQKKRKTVDFATVIAYRYGVRGCHIIYHKWSVRRKGYGRGDALVEKRLRIEVEKTMEVAIKLQEHSIKVHQIDFDLNCDPKWKSNKFVQMAVGWAKGLGYKISIKPDEQVATKAADQIVGKGLLSEYNN